MNWWDTNNTHKCMQKYFRPEKPFSKSIENPTYFVMTMLKQIFLLPSHFCHFVMTMSKLCQLRYFFSSPIIVVAKLLVSNHFITFHLL